MESFFDPSFDPVQEWERLTLQELYKEYRYILQSRRITMPPAAIELFDSNSHWGEWVPQTRAIRLSRRLLKSHSWFQVLGILKHEMAHQYVEEGPKDPTLPPSAPHGEAFQRACRRLGVPAAFSKASANLQKHTLDWREEKRDEAAEKLFEKVQKLLALAASSNEHEALLAMNRVREIYAKHNLEKSSSHQVSEYVHVIITRGSKRLETYERKIIGIIVGHFFVEAVIGQAWDVESCQHHRVIELIGSRENAVMAEYVYHFLERESQFLVQEAEKKNGKKFPRVMKKSYRLGVLSGFAEKLAAVEKDSGSAETSRGENLIGRALVNFQKDRGLNNYLATIYPRLRTLSGKSQSIDADAYNAGQSAGRRITLHKPLTAHAGNKGRLLGSTRRT